jgi:hypothetical protein
LEEKRTQERNCCIKGRKQIKYLETIEENINLGKYVTENQKQIVIIIIIVVIII